jgi:transitional endoplasmic reticulum ATPase
MTAKGKIPEPVAAKADDVSQAILKRKASPNKLLVDDATNDDNSVCTMNTQTMETLMLFRGYSKLI